MRSDGIVSFRMRHAIIGHVHPRERILGHTPDFDHFFAGRTKYLEGLVMRKALASCKRTGKAARWAFAGGALMAALSASVAVAPAHAAELPNADTAIPRLMQEPGVAWRAYLFGGRQRPPSPADVPYDRTANEWLPPASGIGPITADPAHPFYNNAVAADLGVSSTYRVADLTNEAARNLMPWVSRR